MTGELAERFWAKVESRSDEECWPWLGAKAERGYGRIWNAPKMRPAHRVAWELHYGVEISDELDACHSCDNPSCVNPKHVFPGTASDNAKDAYAKGRLYNPQSVKTHCPQGHPLSGDNLYVPPSGKRYCRACQQARRHERYYERERPLHLRLAAAEEGAE